MQDEMEPSHVMAAAFALSSLGGLASLLRSEQPLTPRIVFGALLYSGVGGIAIALIWYNYFNAQGNIYFLLGVSALAGIGGASMLEFTMAYVKKVLKGGLTINLSTKDGDKPEKSSRRKGNDHGSDDNADRG